MTRIIDSTRQQVGGRLLQSPERSALRGCPSHSRAWSRRDGELFATAFHQTERATAPPARQPLHDPADTEGGCSVSERGTALPSPSSGCLGARERRVAIRRRGLSGWMTPVAGLLAVISTGRMSRYQARRVPPHQVARTLRTRRGRAPAHRRIHTPLHQLREPAPSTALRNPSIPSPDYSARATRSSASSRLVALIT
jgi:hypothetical protein